MQRVTGLGGVFLKARDPQTLGAWYRDHLGLPVEAWGGCALRWADDPQRDGGTSVWSLFPADTTYFAPSNSPVMINFRVADLHALLAVLRAEGCTVDEKVEESEFGRFGWVMDPEGNRVELWEPPVRG